MMLRWPRRWLLVTILLLSPSLADAENQSARAALETMLARDRFGPPQAELAAWKAFSASPLAQTLGPVDQARTALRLGISYFYTAQYELGLSAVEDAHRLAGATGQMPRVFNVELAAYEALLLADLKRPIEARAAADRALAAAGVGDAREAASFETALALNASGYQAYKAGDLETARAQMCAAAQAAGQALPLSNPLVHVNANNCGVFAYFLDDPDAAAILERTANRTLEHLPPEHPTTGQSLNLSYSVLYRFGYLERAAALARQHMALEVKLRGPLDNRVYDPASMLARILVSADRLGDAADVQAQVVALADAMSGAGDFRPRGFSRIFHARILDQLGQTDKSGPLYEKGIAYLTQDKGEASADTALARMDYAMHLALLGEHGLALKEGTRAVALIDAALPDGHIDRRTGQLKHALLQARSGRCDLASPQLKADLQWLSDRFGDMRSQRAGRLASATLLKAGFALVAETAARCERKDTMVQAAQLYGQSELALAVDQVGLEHAIRPGNALTLAQAQAGLSQDEAALFVLPAHGGVLSLAVTKTQITQAFSPATAYDVQSDIRAILRNINAALLTGFGGAPAYPKAVAETLYTRIAPPLVHETLMSKTRVILPASGPLSQVPFGVLMYRAQSGAQSGDLRFLAETHQISIQPMLYAGRPAPHTPKALRYVGFGDPTRWGNFGTLPAARRNLKAIRSLFGRKRSTVLAGDAFTRSNVLAQPIDRTTIAVFATHGLSTQEAGGAPALLVSEAEVGVPPVLTAGDIGRASFPAHWVLLSACSSAAGRQAGAPPFSGLAQAFTRAGAHALLVTHWPVRDEDAAFLNRAALKSYLRGKAKSEALWMAQQALRKSLKNKEDHPAFWAGYTLITLRP